MLGEPAARQDSGEGRGSLSYGDKMCGVLYRFLCMFIIEFWGEKIEHFREGGKKALDLHLEMTLL